MIRHFAILLLVVLASLIVSAQVKPTPRIKSVPDIRQMTPLTRQVHSLARPEFDQGAVDSNLQLQRIVLLLKPSDEQQKALDQFLIDVQDKSSPQYHHWLTPDEFGRQFGVADADIQSIQSWLQAQGFTLGPVAHNHLMLEFNGTASQVSSTFRTEIHNYSINGEAHIANATNPSIPTAFAAVISGFLSLHNFRSKPMSHILRHSEAQPLYNQTGGTHALVPDDFAIIYDITPLYNSGIDGAGQTIAIPSRTDFDPSDIVQFQYSFNLPVNSPNVIHNGADPGDIQADIPETQLDLEWSGAVARKASITAVVSADTNTSDGIDLSNVYIVDNNLASVLGVSYGFCERQFPAAVTEYTSLWRQAAAEGISVVVATGDSGSAGCDDPTANSAKGGLAVSGMASEPDVLAVGGTQFNDVSNPSAYWSSSNGTNSASALGYIPEVVWNESLSGGLWAGAGGVSTIFATPSWQTGSGIPTGDPGNSGAHHRYLPDVSLSAALHDGYSVCILSYCSAIVSGTSASAEAFAGVMALVDQKMGGPQGNPNFHIYPLSNTVGIYHDTTTGTNAVPCTTGTPNCSGGKMTGYSAGPGFDLATGWGSVDVNNLVTNWQSVTFQPTSVSGASSPTTFQHGATINLSATVTANSGTPSGAVSAYAVSGGQTVQLAAASLSGGTASGTTNKVPGGNPTLYFRYAGDGTYGSSTSSGFPLTVTPEPSTVTATSPAPVPWTLNSYVPTQVAGTSGVGVPSGTVTVSQNGTSVGSATLDPTGSANVPIYLSGSPTQIGTQSFSVSYSGDNSFASASSAVSVTITKAVPAAVLNCDNGSQNIIAGISVNCQATVFGGNPEPTGTVQFTDLSNPVGSPVTLGSVYGARTVFSNIQPGPHSIGFQYSGDGYYLPATNLSSETFTAVSQATLTYSLIGLPAACLPGSSFQAFAMVQSTTYGPEMTGTISLIEDGTVIGSATMNRGTGNVPSPDALANFTLNTADQPFTIGTHVFTLSYSGDNVWPAGTSRPQNVIVSNPDIVLTGVNALTVTQGSSNGMNLLPVALGNVTGTITLTCSGAPAEATCTISPSTIQGGSLCYLTVTTTGPHSNAQHNQTARLQLLFLPLAVVLISTSRKRRYTAALVVLVVFSLALIPSCGGGGGGSSSVQTGSSSGGGTTGSTDPGTPKGNYTLTVTTTYGSGASAVTHTYPFQLTVQ